MIRIAIAEHVLRARTLLAAPLKEYRRARRESLVAQFYTQVTGRMVCKDDGKREWEGFTDEERMREAQQLAAMTMQLAELAEP
jgi:hypothetical protein